jgi:AraC-like DNA-binding protein
MEEHAMAEDVLSAVLRSVRIAGSLQFCVAAAGTWQTDATPRLGRGTGNPSPVLPFHVVAEGGCWLRIEGKEFNLEQGDVVAFPFGTGHAVGVGEDGMLIQPSADLPPKPWPDIPVVRYGNGPPSLRLLCGYINLDALNFEPLRQSLPCLIHVKAYADDAGPLLRSAVQQMIAEADGKEAGGQSVLERLTEIILIELLRHEILVQKISDKGLLSAMTDPVLGHCLAAIHGDPGKAWSVPTLARVSAVSRSVLEERFQNVLATSPMRYLRDWRLYLASVALRGSKTPISRIALEAGYGTEAAFNRAFSKSFGQPPARWRTVGKV